MSDAAGHSIFTIGHSNRLRVAIMCAEAMPWRCHRSLIADAVVERGIPVSHILSATRAQAHALPRSPGCSRGGSRTPATTSSPISSRAPGPRERVVGFHLHPEDHALKTGFRLLALAVALTAPLVASSIHGAPAAKAPPTPASRRPSGAIAVSDTVDPYRWLEDVIGQKSLDWVAQRNAESKKALTTRPGFDATQARFLSILDSDARIPAVTKIGKYYYNFWKDKDHERGIWRRTTFDEYRKDKPAWETVIDLDALSRPRAPCGSGTRRRRCRRTTHAASYISLGGADAEVVREFDLVAERFVPDGFRLAEAKSDVAWEDQDHLYVGTDFGPGSMTTSGYPRIVKEWKRGTPLGSATTLYEGKNDDVDISAYRDQTPGFEKDFVYRTITFYSSQVFLRRDGKLIPIEKPDDADMGTFRDWLLLRLRTAWTTGGKTWPAGALDRDQARGLPSGQARLRSAVRAEPARLARQLRDHAERDPGQHARQRAQQSLCAALRERHVGALTTPGIARARHDRRLGGRRS